MDVLLFSLNGIAPVILTVLLGYILKRVGLFGENLISGLNQLCFQALLPIMLFYNIQSSDFFSGFDISFVLYGICSILVIYFLSWFIAPRFIHDRGSCSSVIHTIFRSNFLQIGYALVLRLFGDSAVPCASVMLAFTIPLFNLLAVVLLTYFGIEDHTSRRQFMLRKVISGTLHNHLFIASLLGLLFSLCKISIPVFLGDTLKSTGGISTTLCLLMIGAQFDPAQLNGNLRLAAITTTIKLIFIPVIFCSLAIWLNFRNEQLGVIFLLLCAPSAVNSYIMAKSMNGNDVLAGQIVVLSTAASAFTIFVGTFLLRSWQLI